MSNPDHLLPELEIEFDEPVEVFGERHSSITLREPKAREMEQALAVLGSNPDSAAMYRYQVELLAKVSGKKRQVIEHLPVRKLKRGFDYCTSFLEDDGPSTGGKE